MTPRFRPALGWEEIAAALRLPSPTDVADFETAFAAEMGQKHAVAFPYGRTALMVLLEALGLKDSEIVCPAYTCVVVAHAIVHSGNRPVFVDSSPADFNMRLDLAEEAITGRTAAIVVTSLFGYPADLDRLESMRARHPGVRVIQDCAHSFAAEWKGRPVQRCGDAAIYGLNISKTLTSIFGGMVTTDDDALASAVRRLRSTRLKPASMLKGLRRLLYLLAVYPAFSTPMYGVVHRLQKAGLLDRLTVYYKDDEIDMPADFLDGMAAIEARVGARQTAKYHGIVSRRRRNAEIYDGALRSLSWLERPPLVEGATYSHYVCRVGDRDRLVSCAARRGVELGILIEYCIPGMAAYRGRAPRPAASFPVAEALARSCINLPVTCSEAQARRVCGVLTNYRPPDEYAAARR
jgi:perosamine synthetase